MRKRIRHRQSSIAISRGLMMARCAQNPKFLDFFIPLQDQAFGNFPARIRDRCIKEIENRRHSNSMCKRVCGSDTQRGQRPVASIAPGNRSCEWDHRGSPNTEAGTLASAARKFDPFAGATPTPCRPRRSVRPTRRNVAQECKPAQCAVERCPLKSPLPDPWKSQNTSPRVESLPRISGW